MDRELTVFFCETIPSVNDSVQELLANIFGSPIFWATVCKVVRLCYRTVVCVCLSVCACFITLVYCGQNGWMDQDDT